MGGGELINLALKFINDDMLEKVEFFEDKTYTKQDNDEATMEFKRLFNYYLKYEYREKILDKIVAHFSSDEEIFTNLYMSEMELKQMHENKMILGSHSVSHAVFSKLSQKEQVREIKHSFGFLQDILGFLYVKCFCYPYGGFHTFTDFTEQALNAEGVAFSFNVESKDIKLENIINRPQALPRYDCNEFRFGKSSLG